MTSTYRGSSRTRDQAIADEHTQGYMPCSFCGQQTEWATLSAYGARCGACFNAYCTGGKRPGPMPSLEQRRAVVAGMKAALSQDRDPRSWAYALRRREESGEVLSATQREAWRRALRAHSVLDAVADGADVPAALVTAALRETGDLPPTAVDVVALEDVPLDAYSDWEAVQEVAE